MMSESRYRERKFASVACRNSLAHAKLSRGKERNCILLFVLSLPGMLIGLSTTVTYCDSLLRIKLVTLKV